MGQTLKFRFMTLCQRCDTFSSHTLGLASSLGEGGWELTLISVRFHNDREAKGATSGKKEGREDGGKRELELGGWRRIC